mmetsp:Transcript_19551/g.27480  ORF Transcript_19551/g.27480 Transcript_19551/m.27480 type:complete len:624 (+) Transcript_19551:76-1947(+)|eukprot:CAMPEP_0171457674 /NCGR_PEP_ID=MMETSP0945-20130129/3658_1 /TAXON_ID=109269 /ORGANISM="Vaucheria litorea, Strain CCMP2940" /LENGTH=623 /DNA_ID=CAMNT_0011983329 /DNA_START=29 /DNA_END=1900 /DNA_ORIENTATION=+
MNSELVQCFPVISNDPPSSRDLAKDAQLLAYMSKNVPVMSTQEMIHRERVLSEVTQIFKRWVRETCIAKGLNEEVAAAAGGIIRTSGSYRLAIHEPGSDIDAHCCAPMHCTRADFFSTLKNLLQNHPDVTNFNAIDTAAVPIMTFDFDGVNIDLGLACLPVESISEDFNIDDDNVLRGVDQATEKCLNGPRVTNLIHKLVPNYDSFLPVVRLVRLWAKRRGIYGNKMGYLGGVNFNILVAFACQLYPRASPSKLLASFFKLMNQWVWPNPIQLVQPHDSKLGLQVWQPAINHWHVMPIITPAYPAMNSSVAVSAHSLEVMKREFKRADNICKEILEGEDSGNWDELIQPSDFFATYSHYLAVDIMAGSEEEFRAWRGYMESRARKLLDNFTHMRVPARDLHLYPRSFERCCSGGVNGELPAHCVCYFVGFNVDKSRLQSRRLDLGHVFQKFEEAAMAVPWIREGMCLALSAYSFKTLPAWSLEDLGGRDAAREIRVKRRLARGTALKASSIQNANSTILNSSKSVENSADKNESHQNGNQNIEEKSTTAKEKDERSKAVGQRETKLTHKDLERRIMNIPRRRPEKRDFFVLEPVIPEWRLKVMEKARQVKRVRVQLLPPDQAS